MNHWVGWVHAHQIGTWDSDLCGYIASALVFATFSMKSMRWLRLMAIVSNVAFICYAFVTVLPPILALHGVLLPLNLYRLVQAELARADGRQAETQLIAQVSDAFD